jgi:hypothetical protein
MTKRLEIPFQKQVILEGPQLVHTGAYDSIAWEPCSGDVFGNRKGPAVGHSGKLKTMTRFSLDSWAPEPNNVRSTEVSGASGPSRPQQPRFPLQRTPTHDDSSQQQL